MASSYTVNLMNLFVQTVQSVKSESRILVTMMKIKQHLKVKEFQLTCPPLTKSVMVDQSFGYSFKMSSQTMFGVISSLLNQNYPQQ